MYLNYNGKRFECEKAIKGDDFIECLDEKGERIILFQGISDFTMFISEGGAFTDAPLDDITQLQLAISELAELVVGGAV